MTQQTLEMTDSKIPRTARTLDSRYTEVELIFQELPSQTSPRRATCVSARAPVPSDLGRRELSDEIEMDSRMMWRGQSLLDFKSFNQRSTVWVSDGKMLSLNRCPPSPRSH